MVGKNIFEVQGVLRGHMDGVRCITINESILASASEVNIIILHQTGLHDKDLGCGTIQEPE